MHRADGRVGEVSDELLEQWAMWRGKPGRFAAAFRERCVDESGNLRGWWRNEGVLREQERSRRKPVRPNGLPENPRGESRQIPAGILRGTPTNPRGDSPGNPDKSPRGFSGEPRQIPAGILRGTPTNPRGDSPRIRYVDGTELQHPSPREAVPGFAALLTRLPDTGGARVAVTEFCEASPGTSVRGWVAVLSACLDGLDTPAGQPVDPERLATVCRDFLTKPGADWNARYFRACLAPEAPRPSRPGRGVTQREAATLDAARAFAEGG